MLNYLLLLSFFAVGFCEKRPNFVLVLTDDQDVVLGGMTPMTNVQRFIADEGVTFTNSYVSSPICCPSRASFLTGMYVHNHRTINNSLSGGCYGDQWRHNIQPHTFATIFMKEGYNTFYAGKYLNQYGHKDAGGPTLVPPGWTEWHGLVGNSVYYNYTISNNGVPTHSTDQYLTDVVRDLGVSFIENQTESTPFLMVLAPPAPHQPFTPARRHESSFDNVTALRNPSFNVTAEDKHWLLRMSPSPLDSSIAASLDQVFRSRWRALLAVDEMIADVINTLDTRAYLDNTYVIYTSDNGYHVGQFSQIYDKRQPYETDTKVPFVMKGPGIKPNTTSSKPIVNIDIAPTILTLAGIKVPTHMDGMPISLEEKEKIDERYMLVEYYGEGNDNTVDEKCPWKYDGENLSECYPQYECKCQDSRNNTYGCVRHIGPEVNKKYCVFLDDELFVEIYDLDREPNELTNLYNYTIPAVRHWYHNKLAHLSRCAGASCREV